MYDLAYYKAEEMLQKNRPVLEKIVEELLEFEILTRKVNNHFFELLKLSFLFYYFPQYDSCAY
jgi:ATP-dependent Zn protease